MLTIDSIIKVMKAEQGLAPRVSSFANPALARRTETVRRVEQVVVGSDEPSTEGTSTMYFVNEHGVPKWIQKNERSWF